MTTQERSQLVLLFLLNPNEQTIYGFLKNTTVRNYQVKSQFVLTSSLREQSTALSVAGKIVIQIAAKKGLSLWQVERKHPYWAGKKVAIASMGYSRN